jgi:ribonuclease J
LSEGGTIVGGPDIITRGVVHVDASQDLIARGVSAVREVLDRLDRPIDAQDCGEHVRQTLRRFFRRELARRPLVLPVVMSI